MADNVDRHVRSRMMASIRSKDTKPELVLRRALHSRGFRFRLHSNRIKGRPDIVLPKYRAVVFVHGCFWHRHKGCRYTTTPSTRPEFWRSKFEANTARDKAVQESLLDEGWRVAVVWECTLRRYQEINAAADALSEWLRSASRQVVIDAASDSSS